MEMSDAAVKLCERIGEYLNQAEIFLNEGLRPYACKSLYDAFAVSVTLIVGEDEEFVKSHSNIMGVALEKIRGDKDMLQKLVIVKALFLNFYFDLMSSEEIKACIPAIKDIIRYMLLKSGIDEKYWPEKLREKVL